MSTLFITDRHVACASPDVRHALASVSIQPSHISTERQNATCRYIGCEQLLMALRTFSHPALVEPSESEERKQVSARTGMLKL
jgi:hypothetical protein